MGQQLDEICSLPLDDEEQQDPTCYAYIERFRYNPNTNFCEQFIYGGCGGNKNNYSDEESCIAACMKQ